MSRVAIGNNVVDFPDSLTPDQLQSAVSAAASQLQPQVQNKTPLQQFKTDLSNSNGVMGTANTLLKAPEKLSRQGLQIISNAIPNPEPTGNLPLDLIKGTPRIAADTLAEVAPGFVSKGAILTSGALKGIQVAKPLINAAGRGIARGAEALSGLEHKTPGVLLDAANNLKTIAAPGREVASPAYEAAKNELPFIAKKAAGLNPFQGMIKNNEIVAKAQQMLDAGEELLPTEAFQARKAADSLKGSKSINQDALIELRGKLAAIAKGSKNVAEGDKLYQQGLKAEALRSFLPLNKTGGASTFKTMVGAALKGAGTLGVMSPIVQGATATAIGAADRAVEPLINNPVTTAGVAQIAKMAKNLTIDKAKEYLRKSKGDRDKARQMATADGYKIPSD